MVKRKTKLQALLNGRAASAKKQTASAVDDGTANDSATSSSIRPTPRQRGRPRKHPVGDEAVIRLKEAANNTSDVVKVLIRAMKDQNKPIPTANNGFARGLKPETITAGFRHEGQLFFAVKFKNRKLPEIIVSTEVKLRAPSLLIQYYVAHLQYPHNDPD